MNGRLNGSLSHVRNRTIEIIEIEWAEKEQIEGFKRKSEISSRGSDDAEMIQLLVRREIEKRNESEKREICEDGINDMIMNREDVLLKHFSLISGFTDRNES